MQSDFLLSASILICIQNSIAIKLISVKNCNQNSIAIKLISVKNAINTYLQLKLNRNHNLSAIKLLAIFKQMQSKLNCNQYVLANKINCNQYLIAIKLLAICKQM